tara:strand:+ start:809 stop:1036 length:228 start_codon:yes stop_codon:yes gene_type:complete
MSRRTKQQQRAKAQREQSRRIRQSEAQFPGLLSIVNSVVLAEGQLLRRSDGGSVGIEEQIVWEAARGLLYDEGGE